MRCLLLCSLAVIAFAHNAQVVLPPTRIADRARIEDVINTIDRFDVDPGGTAMDEGLSLGLAEVEKNAGPGRVSQVLVLTDGETSGEQNCRNLAAQAAARKIRLTPMGVGTEWNSTLIKDLARLGEGARHGMDHPNLDASRLGPQDGGGADRGGGRRGTRQEPPAGHPG